MTRRYRGFTLLEVLLASLISVLIAVTAVAGFRMIVASREVVEERLELQSELRYVAGMIRADLVNLYRDGNVQSRKLVGDIGDRSDSEVNVLRMYCLNQAKARSLQPEGDVYEIEYFLMKNDERTTLMRRKDPYPFRAEQEDSDDVCGIMTALTERVELFTVRFFDTIEQEWLEDWPEEQTELPGMVEVVIAGRYDQDDEEMPEMEQQKIVVGFPRMPATVQPNRGGQQGRGGGGQRGGGGGGQQGQSGGQRGQGGGGQQGQQGGQGGGGGNNRRGR